MATQDLCWSDFSLKQEALIDAQVAYSKKYRKSYSKNNGLPPLIILINFKLI